MPNMTYAEAVQELLSTIESLERKTQERDDGGREALAVLRRAGEERAKCLICQGVGTVTTWRDGGTGGRIKDTLICGECNGTGKES